MSSYDRSVSRRHLAAGPLTRAVKMLNKVPEVTLFFWVIKVLATTVGETAADYLNDNLGFGLTGTTIVMGALLVVVLVLPVPDPALRPRPSTGSPSC